MKYEWFVRVLDLETYGRFAGRIGAGNGLLCIVYALVFTESIFQSRVRGLCRHEAVGVEIRCKTRPRARCVAATRAPSCCCPSSSFLGPFLRRTTVNALLKEWEKIISTIPEYIRRAARGDPLEWRYSAQAQSMMSALGWTPGLGLGPTLSGRPTIVEAGMGNENHEGLGLRPNRGKRIKKDNIRLVV